MAQMEAKYQRQIAILQDQSSELKSEPTLTETLLNDVADLKSRLADAEVMNRKIQARFGIK